MRRTGDQSFKSVAEEDARGLLAMVRRVPLSAKATVRPLERELTREPLLVDHAYHVRQGRKNWIEHLEAFTRWPLNAPSRLAEYAQEISVKTKLPVYSTAVLLLEAYDPGSVPSFGRIVRGGVVTTARYQVVKLWKLPAAQLLESRRPFLLPWVALCNARPAQLIEAGRRISETSSKVEPRVRAMFHSLGGLRYGKDEWRSILEEEVSMFLTREILRESPYVQDLLKEGKKEGKEKGKEEGRQEGLRLAVQQVIEVRFPSLIPEAKALNSINRASDLKQLHNDLMGARSVAAARRLLQAIPPPRSRRQAKSAVQGL
ncbi:MAG: hypothetical protein HY820_12905 [Acidobacteria bacterium]|nr:hypothetical protein [Acidobacteriota bacterium]